MLTIDDSYRLLNFISNFNNGGVIGIFCDIVMYTITTCIKHDSTICVSSPPFFFFKYLSKSFGTSHSKLSVMCVYTHRSEST